jgi:hypothetical protein
MDMVDPQPTLVERLVRHVLLPRALLPQIEINSPDIPGNPTLFFAQVCAALQPVNRVKSGGIGNHLFPG